MSDYDDKYALSQDEYNQCLDLIIERLFAKQQPVNNPHIVVLGGQPASGKGFLIRESEKEFKDTNYIVINGDEFRVNHPYADIIIKEDERNFAKHTDAAVRLWTQAVFNKAITEKYNIVFEGTMRTPKICNTLQMLKEYGYTIDIKIMAVNQYISRSGIFNRYNSMRIDRGFGRYSERQSHDSAYTGMLNTINKIENDGLFDKMEVYCKDSIDGRVTCAATCLRGEHKNIAGFIADIRERQWTSSQYDEFTDRNTTLMDALINNDVSVLYRRELQGIMKEARQMLLPQEDRKNIINKQLDIEK